MREKARALFPALLLAGAAAVALALSPAWGEARAQEAAKKPGAGRAALIEARFRDACLDDPAGAEPLYKKALDEGLEPLDEAEALYGLARCRILDGRRAPGEAILERLAERIANDAIRPWPRRARSALEKLAVREDPFERRPRGEGVFTIHASAEPLVRVLRDLLPRTRVAFALDETVQPSFLVTAQMEDLSLEEIMDRLVGKGLWRRVGNECMAVGEVARDGDLFARVFTFDALRDPAEREVAGILCTRRISASLPGTPLVEAVKTLDAVAGAKIEVERAVLEGRARTARLFAKDTRVDEVLDIFTVPLGLTWRIEGAKVVLRERKMRASE